MAKKKKKVSLFKKISNKFKHSYRVAQSVVREKSKDRKRSPQWKATRNAYLEKNPECAACGGKSFLQVHHIQPFALAPDLECEPNNLITMCMGTTECHLKLAHGDDFHHYNPHIVRNAVTVRRNPSRRIDMEKMAIIHRVALPTDKPKELPAPTDEPKV